MYGQCIPLCGIRGKIARVVKFHHEVDRYEVKFEGDRYDGITIKVADLDDLQWKHLGVDRHVNFVFHASFQHIIVQVEDLSAEVRVAVC